MKDYERRGRKGRRQHGLKGVLESGSPFASYLSSAEMVSLARACSGVHYSAGAFLDESPFYILLSGTVAILQSQENPAEQLGATHFREVCTRSPDSPDAAFITNTDPGTHLQAKTQVKALAVSSAKRFDDFLERCSAIARDGCLAIVRNSLTETLARVPFIADAQLDGGSLHMLGAFCSYVTVTAGTVVFAQGEQADALYIVIEGKVEVVVHEGDLTGVAEAAEEAAIGLIHGAGEPFGVSGTLIDPATDPAKWTARKYSMRATERTLLLRAPNAHFAPFLAEHPSLHASLTEASA